LISKKDVKIFIFLFLMGPPLMTAILLLMPIDLASFIIFLSSGVVIAILIFLKLYYKKRDNDE